MVDQHAQLGVSAQPAGTGEAMRELAHAIRDLAMAIRDSAAFTELEFVPCGEVTELEDAGDPCGQPCGNPEQQQQGWRTASGNDTALPLVPAPRQSDTTTEPEPGGLLCRPGGCGCSQPDDNQGRHARRDSEAADSGAGAQAGTR